jgi:lipopolysaccharide/colanic/teichoic acid biosynthesis glycosyltransferase
VPLDELEEGWFIEHVVTRRPVYDQTKRLIDFVLSIVLFTALLPLSALIAILVKITSAGPIIYAQKRTGKNDRPFTLYKFRSMAHEAGGAYWTEDNDVRITSFGKILRRSHLDELPQLWNIARGDISFTGPRPERVELAEKYRAFPYYNIRHVVTPGLTGWAQINYKSSASLEEGREKLKYDIYYVKNRSFFLDIAIILKTVKYIFSKTS